MVFPGSSAWAGAPAVSKRVSLIPYALAALVAGLVVLFAWVNRDRLRPVSPGRPAPNFSAYDTSGTLVTMEDFRGKVLLINIWATWCTGCLEEMPSMQRLYEELHDGDFEILAVSIDAPMGEQDRFGEVGGDFRAFSESLGLTFPIFHDPTGRIGEIYQITGVPESFVVNREGVIFRKIFGSTAWDAPPNVQFIRRLLSN